jgi:hypothetical protein
MSGSAALAYARKRIGVSGEARMDESETLPAMAACVSHAPPAVPPFDPRTSRRRSPAQSGDPTRMKPAQ